MIEHVVWMHKLAVRAMEPMGRPAKQVTRTAELAIWTREPMIRTMELIVRSVELRIRENRTNDFSNGTCSSEYGTNGSTSGTKKPDNGTCGLNNGTIRLLVGFNGFANNPPLQRREVNWVELEDRTINNSPFRVMKGLLKLKKRLFLCCICRLCRNFSDSCYILF